MVDLFRYGNNFMSTKKPHISQYFICCIIGFLLSILSLSLYSVWEKNYQQNVLLQIYRNSALAQTSIQEMDNTTLVAICHVRSGRYGTNIYREILLNNQIGIRSQETDYVWQQLNLPKCSKDGGKYELPVKQARFEVFQNTHHLLLLNGQKYSENQKNEPVYFGYGNLSDVQKAEIMLDEETDAIWHFIWMFMSLPSSSPIWGLIIWVAWLNFPQSKQS